MPIGVGQAGNWGPSAAAPAQDQIGQALPRGGTGIAQQQITHTVAVDVANTSRRGSQIWHGLLTLEDHVGGGKGECVRPNVRTRPAKEQPGLACRSFAEKPICKL